MRLHHRKLAGRDAHAHRQHDRHHRQHDGQQRPRKHQRRRSPDHRKQQVQPQGPSDDALGTPGAKTAPEHRCPAQISEDGQRKHPRILHLRQPQRALQHQRRFRHERKIGAVDGADDQRMAQEMPVVQQRSIKTEKPRLHRMLALILSDRMSRAEPPRLRLRHHRAQRQQHPRGHHRQRHEHPAPAQCNVDDTADERSYHRRQRHAGRHPAQVRDLLGLLKAVPHDDAAHHRAAASPQRLQKPGRNQHAARICQGTGDGGHQIERRATDQHRSPAVAVGQWPADQHRHRIACHVHRHGQAQLEFGQLQRLPDHRQRRQVDVDGDARQAHHGQQDQQPGCGGKSVPVHVSPPW